MTSQIGVKVTHTWTEEFTRFALTNNIGGRTVSITSYRVGGRVAATAAAAKLKTGRIKGLQLARKLFMREQKQVLRVLGAMQKAYYRSYERRERFVSLCHDVNMQKVTFEAYMNKSLAKAWPMAHLKIGINNLAHLSRLVSTLST